MSGAGLTRGVRWGLRGQQGTQAHAPALPIILPLSGSVTQLPLGSPAWAAPSGLLLAWLDHSATFLSIQGLSEVQARVARGLGSP